jgi:membrane fusion protein (multidrug efflux system)
MARFRSPTPAITRTVVLIAAAASITACGKPEPPTMPPMSVAVLKVQPRDIPIYLDMIGQTLGSVDIPIRARVDGVLEEIHFLEGRDVTKDQLLYVIDPTPYRAKVVEAEGRLAEAETRLAKAASDLERIRPLAEMDAVSKQDLDGAVAQFEAAEGSLQAARAQVEQAEIQLGYTRIKAPVSGLIGITQAKVGEYVGRSPNPVVLNVVSQTDPIRVRFSINEREYLRFSREFSGRLRDRDASKANGGALRLILSDGSIHDYPGEVVSFDASIDPTTGTLTLEADFPNPERIVLPGQFARVRGVLEEREAALAVPQRAVMETQGIFQLAVVGDDGTVDLRQVQMGPRVDDQWIVESGLEPGERVALEGLQRMRPGMQVVAKDAPVEPAGGG